MPWTEALAGKGIGRCSATVHSQCRYLNAARLRARRYNPDLPVDDPQNDVRPLLVPASLLALVGPTAAAALGEDLSRLGPMADANLHLAPTDVAACFAPLVGMVVAQLERMVEQAGSKARCCKQVGKGGGGAAHPTAAGVHTAEVPGWCALAEVATPATVGKPLCVPTQNSQCCVPI